MVQVVFVIVIFIVTANIGTRNEYEEVKRNREKIIEVMKRILV